MPSEVLSNCELKYLTQSRTSAYAFVSQNDGKAATLIVTLPIHFGGGALIVQDFDGNTEKHYGRNGNPRDLEWTAFLDDCTHEVDTVTQGVRLTISYSVFIRTSEIPTLPLPLKPKSPILHRRHPLRPISRILNIPRRQKIAFCLCRRQDITPTNTVPKSSTSQVRTCVLTLLGTDTQVGLAS